MIKNKLFTFLTSTIALLVACTPTSSSSTSSSLGISYSPVLPYIEDDPETMYIDGNHDYYVDVTLGYKMKFAIAKQVSQDTSETTINVHIGYPYSPLNDVLFTDDDSIFEEAFADYYMQIGVFYNRLEQADILLDESIISVEDFVNSSKFRYDSVVEETIDGYFVETTFNNTIQLNINPSELPLNDTDSNITDGMLLVMLSACSKIDKTDVSVLPECYYEVYYHYDDENNIIEFNSYEYFEDKYEG